MKLIIAGSREVSPTSKEIEEALDAFYDQMRDSRGPQGAKLAAHAESQVFALAPASLPVVCTVAVIDHF